MNLFTSSESHTPNRCSIALGCVACLSVILFTFAACKSTPVDDATLSRSVQSSLSNDSAPERARHPGKRAEWRRHPHRQRTK